MESINIYIKTSLKWPALKSAAGMWILEHEKNGETLTKDGILYREKIRENELVLQCLINALFVLNKTDRKSGSVTVFTECEHVLNVMNNHLLPVWKKNGWRNSKKKVVSNMLLWVKAEELMEPYAISFAGESHGYSEYMRRSVEKEVERRQADV